MYEFHDRQTTNGSLRSDKQVPHSHHQLTGFSRTIVRTGKPLATFAIPPRLVQGGLGLFEQIVQSALNLAIVAILLSENGLASIGFYATARFGLLLAVGIQNALISFPYTFSFRKLDAPDRPALAGRHAWLSLLFGGLWAALVALTAIWFGYTKSDSTLAADSSLGPMLTVLIVAGPLFLVREFSRRHEFAHLRVKSAVVLTCLSSTIQLAGLLLLMRAEQVNEATIFAAVGLGCGISSAIWLALRWSEFDFRFSGVVCQLNENWLTGRWMFGSQALSDCLLFLIQGGLTLWAGSLASGAFAAAFTLVGLASPIIAGISNLLPASFAGTLAQDGRPAMLKLAWKYSIAMTLLVGCLLLGIFLCGEWLVGLLHDEPIGNLGTLLGVLCVAVLLRAAAQPAFHALNTLNRPFDAFVARAIAFLIACIIGLIFLHQGEIYAGGVLLFFQCIALLTTVGFLRTSSQSSSDLATRPLG